MGIPLRIRRRVAGRRWYHQRFDGSPMYLFAVGEAETKREPRKPAGTEADQRVCFFHGGKADWYLDLADVRRGAKSIVKLAQRHHHASRTLMARWRVDETTFQDSFNAFPRLMLRRLRDDELLKLYRRFYELFIRRFTSSAIIDHFALGTDELIAERLRREVGKPPKGSRFTEIFSTATAPVHQSFINLAEAELLKLALLKRVTAAQLKRHQQRYFWLHNNYFNAHVLSVAHFRREIRRWREMGVNLRARYRQLITTPRRNAQAKRALLKRFRLSRLTRTLLKISEDFTWWQDERKKATYLNIHLGTRLLGEMARRRKVNPELTKYLVPPEVAAWFTRGQPTRAELRRRQRGSAYVVTRRGYTIVTGGDVARLRQIIFPPRRVDRVGDLRGLAASVGKAVGTVKVIGSVQEISKVKPGDILVAVMTRPDYIAGIKQAAAIVTNEGGITCHAAIVSRELGIPCIIGTKIATEVLRDGDRVEVNANHGVVKVLERHRT